MMSFFKKKDKWKNFSGCINIYDDLKKSDISKLAGEKDIHSIQFYQFKNPSEKTWETLNLFFNKNPEIKLSILWYDETKWDFLKQLPAVKSLSLKSYLTKDFSTITQYVDLDELHIGETKSVAADVAFIEYFENLKILSIDGMKKGLDSIKNLSRLRSLNLRGIKLKHLDFVEPLEELRLLKLMFGNYEDLSAVSKLTDLEYIGISRTRKIPDYEFLKTLINLQFLHFEGLSQMETIPDLSSQRNLKKIQIENLSRLKNISALKKLESLKELLLFFPENFKLALRESLLQQAIEIMKDLKELELTNLFHWDKNGEMSELKRRGIKPWNHSLTRWTQNSEGGWTL